MPRTMINVLFGLQNNVWADHQCPDFISTGCQSDYSWSPPSLVVCRGAKLSGRRQSVGVVEAEVTWICNERWIVPSVEGRAWRHDSAEGVVCKAHMNSTKQLRCSSSYYAEKVCYGVCELIIPSSTSFRLRLTENSARRRPLLE